MRIYRRLERTVLFIVKAQVTGAAAEQAEHQQGYETVLWWCAGHGNSVAGLARIVLNRVRNSSASTVPELYKPIKSIGCVYSLACGGGCCDRVVVTLRKRLPIAGNNWRIHGVFARAIRVGTESVPAGQDRRHALRRPASGAEPRHRGGSVVIDRPGSCTWRQCRVLRCFAGPRQRRHGPVLPLRCSPFRPCRSLDCSSLAGSRENGAPAR